jgi:hypothetical protein
MRLRSVKYSSLLRTVAVSLGTFLVSSIFIVGSKTNCPFAVQGANTTTTWPCRLTVPTENLYWSNSGGCCNCSRERRAVLGRTVSPLLLCVPVRFPCRAPRRLRGTGSSSPSLSAALSGLYSSLESSVMSLVRFLLLLCSLSSSVRSTSSVAEVGGGARVVAAVLAPGIG